MLRLRTQVGAGSVTLQLQRQVFRRFSSSPVTFRTVGYAWTIQGKCAASMLTGGASQSQMFSTPLLMQRRFQQTSAEGEKPKDEGKTEGADGEKKEKEGEKKPPEPKGLKYHLEGLRRDFVAFPDIYNSANMLNFVLFTVFCLCSTGSNTEEKWWLDNWGIDADFCPWAWPLHSLLMNNFMSMAFAMMMLHTMCHSVMPTLGSRGLFTYLAIISVISGAGIWALNFAMGNRSEKQFGPWDIISGLLVMQYLHQGFTPFMILNSFNGWVKYACWVGAACICYYDWQPLIFGTALGFALCRFHPLFSKVPVAAAA